ncbi:MAG TPA: hypothetical protein VNL18_15510 [Gemmatimonadales bacterium]|nr:hypothetical protein [Gemmatimonadales bacterium]
MRAWLVVAAVLSLARSAVAQNTAQHLEEYRQWVTQTTALSAPDVYRVWWNELIHECACSPLHRFEDLVFATLPGKEFRVPRQFGRARAHWAGGVWIVIAEAYIMDERVVKHELLHAILQTTGHPEIFGRLRLRAQDITN